MPSSCFCESKAFPTLSHDCVYMAPLVLIAWRNAIVRPEGLLADDRAAETPADPRVSQHPRYRLALSIYVLYWHVLYSASIPRYLRPIDSVSIFWLNRSLWIAASH